MNRSNSIAHLTQILVRKNITHAIICPGSRNAPLSMAFVRNPSITTYVMVDERSAAFYALGMAQQTHTPVALICTSGTAALNFAPAIAEAYYQQIPLLILTADRPEELLDQGDGQMINQRNVYANYIQASYNYPISDERQETSRHQERIVIEACNRCLAPSRGPVHINIPFREPLYNDTYTTLTEGTDIQNTIPELTLSASDIIQLSSQWNKASKVMILVGQHEVSSELQEALAAVAEQKQACILTEPTSNLHHPLFHQSMDRTLSACPSAEEYAPELLITLGGNLVSRQIKTLLRYHKPKHHWHLSTQNNFPDTYGALDFTIGIPAAAVFNIINPHIYQKQHEQYVDRWNEQERTGKKRHENFLKDTPYSDLKVFEYLTSKLPKHYDIQLGNSSSIRYYSLFDQKQAHSCFANRGTAGIDGSLSTACGAALATQKPTLVILGDLSFFYDSNALWNNHLPQNIHIIVLNNGGGGIFRYIPGASEQVEVESIFEAHHSFSAKYIAKAFQIEYLTANSLSQMERQLQKLWNNVGKPTLLELFTPREMNGELFKSYFQALRKETKD